MAVGSKNALVKLVAEIKRRSDNDPIFDDAARAAAVLADMTRYIEGCADSAVSLDAEGLLRAVGAAASLPIFERRVARMAKAANRRKKDQRRAEVCSPPGE